MFSFNLARNMSVNEATPVACSKCGAQYKLVRLETNEILLDQQLTCPKCGGPLRERFQTLTQTLTRALDCARGPERRLRFPDIDRRHLRPRFVAVGGLLTGQHAHDLR